MRLSTFLAATAALTSAFTFATAKSLTGDRLLVVLPKADSKSTDEYSNFIDSLKGRGFQVAIEAVNAASLKLFSYGERQYDHLILLAPKAKRISPEVNAKTLIEFLDDGGNLLLTAGTDFGGAQRDFVKQLGVDFDVRGNIVIDHFHYLPLGPAHLEDEAETHSWLLADNFNANATAIVGDSVRQGAPVLFQGVAHRVLPGPQAPLVWPVLSGYPTTYSFDTSEGQSVSGKDTVLAAGKLHLVSAFQAHNNARVVVAGSPRLFSNTFFQTELPAGTGSTTNAQVPAGNAKFADDISAWAFHEKGVVKLRSVTYHKAGEPVPENNPTSFRVSDDIVYTAELSEYYDDKWHPFRNDGVQFEAVMIDPYLRKTLPLEHTTATTAVYSAAFKLPDVYGVFTFKLDFLRTGLTRVQQLDIVSILPFKHNDYPRYLTAAFPYYASAASLMVSFLAFCAIWLYNRPPVAKSKTG
ncbi:oligosaccharyl transferase glycoprotein complex, beta subunit [Tieghemiomyces parasiticus]|uniref:Dolichyl-diphosphooligosaccharide--protein glycosyltransferase subunit WBP1 n=1 Tax=Tieghemiomyces parasiticus TaxID=78921 RepID=A0A9W8AFX5_9FUNG|nr:oligosaccharyl transferase glycoprotein complex, beta subunit [Tieghemiomyces parasiticus]